MRLQLTGHGRFSYYADLNTRRVAEDGRQQLRAMQLTDEAFTIGGVRYVGGWSWWAFDCDGAMAQRIDFASLREDGTIGPITPVSTPPYQIMPGGDAAELAAVACNQIPERVDAQTLAQAMALTAGED